MLPLHASAHAATSPKYLKKIARSDVILVRLLFISSIFLAACGASGVSAYDGTSTAKSTNTRQSDSPNQALSSPTRREPSTTTSQETSSTTTQETSTPGHIAVFATLPWAKVGAAYNAVVSASGGTSPYQFSILSGTLPPGLTINPVTGTISGTPVTPGTYRFAVLATDFPDSDRGDHRMTISVAQGGIPGIAVQVSPTNPTVVASGRQQFTATVVGTSNVAVNWSTTAGTISSNGLFTAPAVSTVTTAIVTATSVAFPSSSGSASLTITPAVPAPPTAPAITTTAIPNATAGFSYLAALAARGGAPPYRWSIASGSLPSGIQLSNTTGTISGLTSVSGSFSFNAQITDTLGQSAQQNFSLTVRSSGGNCGPPTYNCSRTDLSPAPAPTPPDTGNLTGAGTCFNDPDFGSKVCRLTDTTTIGSTTTYVAGNGGSGDTNPFNLDSTKLLLDNVGGTEFPMNFDPATMAITRMYGTWALPNFSGTWSHLNKDILYGITAMGGAYIRYDTSSPTIPSPTTVADFKTAGCLGTGFTVTWNSDGGVSYDGLTFSSGFSNSGGQGGVGALYVAVINQNGCQVLNTSTGVINSNGTMPSGTVSGWVGMTDANGFTIHNVKMARSGSYITITPTDMSCTPCQGNIFFWQVGTLNVSKSTKGGHFTSGYTHFIDASGSQTGNHKIRLFSTPTIQTSIVSPMPTGLVRVFDTHEGWANVDPADTNPFCLTSYTTNVPVPNAPWYNEVMCVDPGSGTTYRFAHTFNTAKSHRFNDWANIGAVSQDGRFYMWSSDWMGTLGSESGASTCTVGVDCRGDVFVVEMQ